MFIFDKFNSFSKALKFMINSFDDNNIHLQYTIHNMQN